ncbi:hypothetical protein AHAS_Ahas15G0191600 [Arachis hypogaea]
MEALSLPSSSRPSAVHCSSSPCLFPKPPFAPASLRLFVLRLDFKRRPPPGVVVD